MCRGSEKYAEDEIIIKSYISIFDEKPDYTSNHFSEVMANVDMMKYKDKIFESYDLILNAYTDLHALDVEKVAFPLVLKKTHFLAYLPYVTISCEKPTPLGVGWIAI